MLVSSVFAAFFMYPCDTASHGPARAGIAGLRHKPRHNGANSSPRESLLDIVVDAPGTGRWFPVRQMPPTSFALVGRHLRQFRPLNSKARRLRGPIPSHPIPISGLGICPARR